MMESVESVFYGSVVFIHPFQKGIFQGIVFFIVPPKEVKKIQKIGVSKSAVFEALQVFQVRIGVAS